MEVERQKNAGEEESENDANDPLSQFDAQMTLLEGKLMEAKYLAAKANRHHSNFRENATTTSTSSSQNEETDMNMSHVTASAVKQPMTLRRPFTNNSTPK